MEKIVLALFFAVVAVAGLPQAPPASLAAPGVISRLECTDAGILGPTPAINQELAKCKDPAIWGTEPGKKNPNCDGICIAKVLDYLGADGKMDKAKYFKFIEADFLPQNQEFAKKHMTKCFADHGSKIDLADPTCDQIKKFDTCGWTMQPNLKC